MSTTHAGGEDRRDRDEHDRDTDSGDRDPSDVFVHGLELPHGRDRELVQDERENLYELNGEDARMLATIGALRVGAERDSRNFLRRYLHVRAARLRLKFTA